MGQVLCGSVNRDHSENREKNVIHTKNERGVNLMRKKIMALIVTIVIVIGELYFMTLEATAGDRQCLASGCKNVRASGSIQLQQCSGFRG